MRLLILGGTRFLGRHLAAIALEHGHAVTLLHRGRSAPALFPEAEHLVADRDGDLAVLGGSRRWDAVIDTSAYVPRQVRSIAALLGGRVDHYQLVSSISVYRDFSRAGIDEDAEAVELADATTEVIDGSSYGGLKRLCEIAAREGFGARAGIVRPGLIVGPHDPTERFTWWLRRMARGGEVLAPGEPAAPVQFIDARDLAQWMLARAEAGDGACYHATGPDPPLSLGELLDTMVQTLAPAGTRLRWAASDWLLAQAVTPWLELPLWLPPEQLGMMRLSPARARTAGLLCRSLAQTLRDTAAWAQSNPAAASTGEGPPRPRTGLEPEREAELFARSATLSGG